MSAHDVAKTVRAKKLARITEMYNACECEWPVRRMRNAHGHGKTADGRLCPAIIVHARQLAERETAQILAEET